MSSSAKIVDRYAIRCVAILLGVLVWNVGAENMVADVLLLKNNNILEGSIRRTSTKYIVSDERGNTTYVPKENVATHGESMATIYQFLLQSVRRADKKGHAQLAQWCIQQKLYHEASDHLLLLSKLDPTYPALESLRKELIGATQQKRPKTNVVPTASDNQVRPATAIVETLPTLPEGSLLDFKRRIQPLLVNRCGQSGCHGGNTKSEFRLVGSSGGTWRRELTLRNLQASVKLLDLENPDESLLLERSRDSHASAKSLKPLNFSQYQSLERWVYEASGQSVDHDETLDSDIANANYESGIGAEDETDEKIAEQAFYDEGRLINEPISSAAQSDSNALVDRRPTRGRPVSKSSIPLDPADFNKLYHPDRD